MRFDQAELIHLRKAPIRDWILQALLAVICLAIGLGFFWLVLKISSDFSNLDTTLILLCASVASLAASIYLGRALITSAVNEAKINLSSQWVEVVRYRIYGKSADRYYFHQIERFKSYKATRFLSSQSPLYSLELTLVNGKKVRIRVTIGSSRTETTRFIKLLNKTLRHSKLTATQTVQE